MVVYVTKDAVDPSPVHPPVLKQAPVKALDPDGMGVIIVGTLAFIVACVVLWLDRDTLAADNRMWWLWVAFAGTLLGLIALGLGLRSGHRRRRHAGQSSADAASAKETAQS